MNTDFSQGKIGKRIIYQALPLMVARAVQLLYSVVDRIYIGHMPGIGSLALTGIGLAFPLTTLIGAFTYWFGNGGLPLFSISRGRKDDEKADKVLAQSLSMLLAISVLVFIFCYTLRKPIMYLFGASDDSYVYADEYLKIYLWGMFFSMFATGMNGYISAMGFPKMGMLTTLTGAVSNMILDPIFIFALNMGIRGAALATVISQAFSAICVLHFLTSKKKRSSGRTYRIHPKLMKPDLPIMKNITLMGFAEFIMAGTNCLNQVICNAVLSIFGGDLYVGAMTIINSVRSMLELPSGCLTSASQPVLSYNYGAKEYERVKAGFRFTLITSLIYTAVVWVIVMLLPHLFMSIFTNDNEIISIGVSSMRQFFLGFVFMAFQYSSQSTFKALGCAKRSIFFSLFRKAIIITPLVLILPMLGLGPSGVFYAEPISNIVGGLVCFFTMYFTVYRKLGKEKI